MHRRRDHRRPAGRGRLPAGWPAGPASAWPGRAAPPTTAAARSSWRWPPGLRAPRGAAPPRVPVTGRALDDYFAAVTEATEEAVINSLLQAVTVTGRDGNTSRQIPADALRRWSPSTRRGADRDGRKHGSRRRRSRPSPPTWTSRSRPHRTGAPDPYAWMRDHNLPALHDYLAAERAYYDLQMARPAGCRTRLLGEMTARVAPAEDSVRWRRGGASTSPGWPPGRNSSSSAGWPAPGAPAEVLLDQNLLLADPACPAVTWTSGCARSARTGGCWPTPWTSPATSCSSCASATWPPGRTCPTASRRPTTAWAGPRTPGRCSTCSPTSCTGRTRSGATNSGPSRPVTSGSTARTTSATRSPSGPRAAAATC